MTPDEIAAVATVLDLLRRKPPEAESRQPSGHLTLAERVRAWLKESL